MTSPDDDQIRAMLEARADRPDGTVPEDILDRVVRSPRPNRTGFGLSRLAGAIAAAALVAAVGAVLLVNQPGRTGSNRHVRGRRRRRLDPPVHRALFGPVDGTVGCALCGALRRTIGERDHRPERGGQPALPGRRPDGPDPELAGGRGQSNRRSPADQQGRPGVHPGGPPGCPAARFERSDPDRVVRGGHHVAAGAGPPGAGGQAAIEVDASNYCGKAPALPVTVAFVLPANAGTVVAKPAPGSDDSFAVPPCMGSTPAVISNNGWAAAKEPG